MILSSTRFLDFINLMAYDYHGSWNQRTGHNSPLFARQEQTGDQLLLNQEATINTWVELGAPAEKLVLGLAMYGRTFTLKTKKMNGMNAPAADAGKSGPYTQAAGFLSYFEICKLLKDGWSKEWNDEQKIPYAFKEDQWVGYDDPKSIKMKCEYAAKRKLAGAMIWSLDLDDFNGNMCSEGKYPLLATIKVNLSSCILFSFKIVFIRRYF
jgi:chitinase